MEGLKLEVQLMPLGEITVRRDWRATEERQQAQRTSNKTALQLTFVGYGLMALGIAAWRNAPWWMPALQSLLFGAAFIWTPLRLSVPRTATGRRTIFVAALALVALAGLAFLTAPARINPLAGSDKLALRPELSALIPLGMAALLAWISARHRGIAHALGFSAAAWGYQAALGVCLGAALGLHLWTTVASALTAEPLFQSIPREGLIWLLATNLGFLSLGEELALRGALFPMLAAEKSALRPGMFIRMVAIGAPLYIAPVITSPNGAPMPVGLLYGAAFAILATVLRFSQRSIIASLAANIAFHLFLAAVMF